MSSIWFSCVIIITSLQTSPRDKFTNKSSIQYKNVPRQITRIYKLWLFQKKEPRLWKINGLQLLQTFVVAWKCLILDNVPWLCINLRTVPTHNGRYVCCHQGHVISDCCSRICIYRITQDISQRCCMWIRVFFCLFFSPTVRMDRNNSLFVFCCLKWCGGPKLDRQLWGSPLFWL